jgi:hypothetical protein
VEQVQEREVQEREVQEREVQEWEVQEWEVQIAPRSLGIVDLAYSPLAPTFRELPFDRID